MVAKNKIKSLKKQRVVDAPLDYNPNPKVGSNNWIIDTKLLLAGGDYYFSSPHKQSYKMLRQRYKEMGEPWGPIDPPVAIYCPPPVTLKDVYFQCYISCTGRMECHPHFDRFMKRKALIDNICKSMGIPVVNVKVKGGLLKFNGDVPVIGINLQSQDPWLKGIYELSDIRTLKFSLIDIPYMLSHRWTPTQVRLLMMNKLLVGLFVDLDCKESRLAFRDFCRQVKEEDDARKRAEAFHNGRK